MINGNLGHRPWFGQAQVDRNPAAALSVWFQRSPVSYATACGAEVEPYRLAPHVDLGRTGDIDAFAFKVVGPKHAVAAAYRAITRCRRLRHSFELPFDCAAVAGTEEHFSTRSKFRVRAAPNLRYATNRSHRFPIPGASFCNQSGDGVSNQPVLRELADSSAIADTLLRPNCLQN